MSLLDRDPTPEDLEAEGEAPRPGVWAGEPGADLRKLTQEETDALIRYELYMQAAATERASIASACGGQPGMAQLEDRKPSPVSGGQCLTAHVLAGRQRGGIDSDPLVRILARRAWGDRDRLWFELRGVQKGDQVGIIDGPHSPQRSRVCRAWGDTAWMLGEALADAQPGEEVAVRWSINSTPEPRVERYVVGDRLRESPWATATTSSLEEMVVAIEGLRNARVTSISSDTLMLSKRTPAFSRPAQERPPVPRWARERGKRTGPRR